MSDDLQRAAENRLHSLISQEAAGIGPHAFDDDGEPIDEQPLHNAMLHEWVLVMAWSDPSSGRSYLTRATSPGLVRHHENGLLHEALFGFD